MKPENIPSPSEGHPFFYEKTVSVPDGGSAALIIDTDSDSEFELHHIGVDHADDADTDILPSNCEVELEVASTKWTQNPVPQRLFAQPAARDGFIRRPVMIPASTKFAFEITDLTNTGAAKDVTITLAGFKWKR